MSDTWMFWFQPQYSVEQGCSLLLFSKLLVHWSRCQRACIQGQRIEDGRLAITRVSLIKLPHRFLISAGACSMVELLPIFVEQSDRIYVISLTLCLCTKPLRFLDFK